MNNLSLKFEKIYHPKSFNRLSSMFLFVLQVIGQYPTPPPVATGPGLDRPIFVPGSDYGVETYTMNRTRMFYQDQV